MAWTLTDYGSFGAQQIACKGFSRDGRVACGFYFSGGVSQPWAFNTTTGVFSPLDVGAAGIGGSANAVSSNGSVIVGSVVNAEGLSRPAIWVDGVLSLPYGIDTADFSGNRGGGFEGVASNGAFAAGWEPSAPWGDRDPIVYSLQLGDTGVQRFYTEFSGGDEFVVTISAGGDVAYGHSTVANISTVLKWTNGVPAVVSVLDYGLRNDNMFGPDDGSYVVYSANNGGSPIFYYAGTQTDIGTLPGGTDRYIWAVAPAAAVLVGESDASDGNYYGFSWTPGGGMVALPPAAEMENSWAEGVSEDGTVVVGASYTVNSVWVPTIWRGGVAEALETLEGRVAAAFINKDKTIIVGIRNASPNKSILVWRRTGFWTGAINCQEVLA